ncbi:hypothetical protein DPMN_164882 [Dreissena polymorpha]|uniref:Uncharacterized protein n=1 Tax=Dreissena polymorpha TaxID=45954 RepID=A0A9D4EVX1_DREPO|nr:hypothetical protein DPMN_164882 [Dreissena polymorpha]
MKTSSAGIGYLDAHLPRVKVITNCDLLKTEWYDYTELCRELDIEKLNNCIRSCCRETRGSILLILINLFLPRIENHSGNSSRITCTVKYQLSRVHYLYFRVRMF